MFDSNCVHMLYANKEYKGNSTIMSVTWKHQGINEMNITTENVGSTVHVTSSSHHVCFCETTFPNVNRQLFL